MDYGYELAFLFLKRPELDIRLGSQALTVGSEWRPDLGLHEHDLNEPKPQKKHLPGRGTWLCGEIPHGPLA